MDQYIAINDKTPLLFKPILKKADADQSGRIDSQTELGKAKEIGKNKLEKFCPKKYQEFLAFLDNSLSYNVEATSYHWNNAEREITALAYYPVGLDVPGEKFPLIVFSHGIGMCGDQSHFLMKHLASKGYVIIAPDHKDSKMCSIDHGMQMSTWEIYKGFIKGHLNLGKTVKALFPEQVEMLKDISYRPEEISFVIDQALVHPFLSSRIDQDRIGMAGHSLGGFTAELIAGAPIDCNPPDVCSAEACSEAEENFDTSEFSPITCCGVGNCGQEFQYADERIKTIMLYGPGSFLAVNEQSFQGIDAPVMIMRGKLLLEVDKINSTSVYNNVESDSKYMLELSGVDHMTVSDKMSEVPGAKALLPGYWFYGVKKEIYEDWSVAFFDAYLKGDYSRLESEINSENCLVELTYDEN